MFSDHLDEVPRITGLNFEERTPKTRVCRGIPLHSLHQGGVVQGQRL